MITFPVFPVHSISKGRVISTTIQAIEIWLVTPRVPPGSFVLNGAVGRKIVIILIFRGEWATAMHSKRVTRISWQNEPHCEYYVSPTISRSHGRTNLVIKIDVFSSCHERGTKKKFWVPMRNRTSDLRICAPMLYHWATKTLRWAGSITKF